LAEVRSTSFGVVACHAPSDDLDALDPGEADPVRVAPDELLLVCAPERREHVRSAAARQLDSSRDDPLVLDVSDGWAACSLVGADAHEAFAMLSPLALPATGAVQGEVVGLPAKVLAGPTTVTVLVPSMWEAFLRSTLSERCGGSAGPT
jgi:hypothetical protein